MWSCCRVNRSLFNTSLLASLPHNLSRIYVQPSSLDFGKHNGFCIYFCVINLSCLRVHFTLLLYRCHSFFTAFYVCLPFFYLDDQADLFFWLLYIHIMPTCFIVVSSPNPKYPLLFSRFFSTSVDQLFASVFIISVLPFLLSSVEFTNMSSGGKTIQTFTLFYHLFSDT